jgi:hypothetical protein
MYLPLVLVIEDIGRYVIVIDKKVGVALAIRTFIDIRGCRVILARRS